MPADDDSNDSAPLIGPLVEFEPPTEAELQDAELRDAGGVPVTEADLADALRQMAIRSVEDEYGVRLRTQKFWNARVKRGYPRRREQLCLEYLAAKDEVNPVEALASMTAAYRAA